MKQPETTKNLKTAPIFGTIASSNDKVHLNYKKPPEFASVSQDKVIRKAYKRIPAFASKSIGAEAGFGYKKAPEFASKSHNFEDVETGSQRSNFKSKLNLPKVNKTDILISSRSQKSHHVSPRSVHYDQTTISEA